MPEPDDTEPAYKVNDCVGPEDEGVDDGELVGEEDTEEVDGGEVGVEVGDAEALGEGTEGKVSSYETTPTIIITTTTTTAAIYQPILLF